MLHSASCISKLLEACFTSPITNVAEAWVAYLRSVRGDRAFKFWSGDQIVLLELYVTFRSTLGQTVPSHLVATFSFRILPNSLSTKDPNTGRCKI